MGMKVDRDVVGREQGGRVGGGDGGCDTVIEGTGKGGEVCRNEGVRGCWVKRAG